ncbi:MAG: precorrin-6y C5,15-methyltransferase (decarboxylating) subunit CbiE [Cyanobacteria bacterium RI_101]|nr:precorrin-6y C5,15-methyltransferase (decarboxylating) subunit CbiE [Cyanobacteria bacterium RI_101]
MIDVVGIGLEGACGLSPRVLALIEEAPVLVGAERHLAYFPRHPGRKILLGEGLSGLAELDPQLPAALLASGDPLFFGLGRLLLTRFPPELLRFHPHLSCLQLAFSRLKLPWQDATVVSLHGRSLELLIPPLQKGVSPLAVLTDAQNNPGAIAQLYRGLDLPLEYEMAVAENLGAPEGEQIRFFDPSAWEGRADFAPLNIVILLRKTPAPAPTLDLAALPRIGLPDALFASFPDRPGLMTKREIRLQILGELDLRESQVVWDIGAGTGSVAIEIARLCPNSRIYAVEKTAMGAALLQENCRRWQTANIEIRQTSAPQGLDSLPPADRIFIGGSGGALEAILEACVLAPGGKILLALATLENLARALTWFNHRRWSYDCLQIQVSKSLGLGALTRLQPLNPVTLLSARPGEESGERP